MRTSTAFTNNQDKFNKIWEQIKLEVYEFENPYSHIEMSDNNGHTSYYSSNITKAEAESITKFMEEQNISPLNTRLIKHSQSEFEILICSVRKVPSAVHDFDNMKVTVTYGDFSPITQSMYKYLA